MSEVRGSKEEGTWRTYARRARDWKWHGFSSTLLGVIALVLAVPSLVLLISAWTSEEPPLQLSVPGRIGDYVITPTSVECGKHEIPVAVQEALIRFRGSVPPVRGQLCFVKTSLHNKSNTTACPCISGALYVGDNEFMIMGADPPEPPYLFPNARATVTFIFDIIDGVEPTKLRFTYKDSGSVYYDLLAKEAT
jgi:hypothetical protein